MIIAVVVFVLAIVSPGYAACTGASPTWVTTPDGASIQTCLSGASLNDTINVSAGSGTIATTVTAPNDLNLSLIGAGIDQTTLSGSATTLINFGRGNKRISGFTFTITGGGIRVYKSMGMVGVLTTLKRTQPIPL